MIKKLIKINNDFSYEIDKYNWVLFEFYDGVDKNGDFKRNERRTYYGTLSQMLNAILDKSLKGCDGLERVIKTIDKLSDALCKFEFKERYVK